jgi:hypothetical protein
MVDFRKQHALRVYISNAFHVGEKMYVNDAVRTEDNKTDDFRLGVPVSN